ncbi:MAG: hypothetical protein HFJ58_03750 [Clostridia bacterium]|nr:hypothetical protein [Clostridia bacterium]
MINLSKRQLAIILGIGAIVIFVIGYYIYKISIPEENYEQLDIVSENDKEQNIENVENQQAEINLIIIHIAGEVKNPGIVKIKEGARIADVIEEAGGLTERANITNINLAYVIEDGQKITIPSKENIEEKESQNEYISSESVQGIIEENPKTSSKTTIVNINKASKEELQTLQGIGESTATKIIEYRKQNGEFKQTEDIKNVPGIGDSKFEAIKDNIKVE